MKKILLMAAFAMIMAGCGFMKNSTTNGQTNNVQTTTTTTTDGQQNTAVTAGQGAGNAILALYKQYKADGNKYDYKNMQNILNTVTLVANCEGLKDNYKNTTYLKEFGKGMIASSLGLITQDNVESVTNGLVDMIQNNETVQNTANTAAGYANTASQYASALSTLLSALGGK